MDDDNSFKVQKNFICDHCYGAFRSSYHLKRHILTHTGENLKFIVQLSVAVLDQELIFCFGLIHTWYNYVSNHV